MSESKPRRRQPNQRQQSDAALAERDEQIWQLRLRGHSLRQIGSQVGLAASSVLATLERGYRERVHPKVDEARALELERLDDWLCKLQPGIEQGDDKAITTALRISDRRSKLLGLDAPTRVDANVSTQESDAVRALAEEAARRVAGA
jgi:DNA-binding CsgD family transcriptional regulator